MWCPGCAKNLENHLKSNLSENEFQINYSQSLISTNYGDFEKLKSLISELGFRISKFKSLSQVKAWQQNELRKLVIYLILACWTFMWSFIITYLYDGDTNNVKIYLNLGLLLFISVPLVHSFKIGILSLWAKYPGIDSFISLAFFALIIHTSVQLFYANSSFIFDSFYMVFMLFTIIRFLEFYFTRKEISQESIEVTIENTTYKVKKKDKIFYKKAVSLSRGNLIILKCNDYIPYESVVKHGTGSIIEDAMSGVFGFRDISINDTIPAGARLITGNIEVEIINENFFLTLNQTNGPLYAKETDILFKNLSALFWFTIGISIFFSFIFYLSNKRIDKTLETFSLILALLNLCYLFLIPIVRDLFINSNYKLKLQSHDFFQKISNIENIIFDKSGTILRDNYLISLKENKTPLSDNQIWSIAFGLETTLSHPIAKSIVSICKTNKIPSSSITEHYYNGSILTGTTKENNIKWTMGERDKNGYIVLRSSIGTCYFEVKLREEMNPIHLFMNSCKNKNIFILTGDSANFSLDEPKNLKIYTGLSPIKKKEFVQKLKGKILYIGDGLNDIFAAESSDIFISFEDSFDSVKFRADALITSSSNINENILTVAKEFNKKLRYYFIFLFILYSFNLILIMKGFFQNYFLLILPLIVIIMGYLILDVTNDRKIGGHL